MRQTLLLIAAVAMVGCGKKTTPAEPETNAEPEPEAKIPTNAFVNTLGMPFVPVPGTDVQFCIWETRVKDYAAYAAANAGVDGSWKQPEFKQTDTHPVVNVNWNDAQAFCAWLTKMELAAEKIQAGQKYRLPTDAEWSVAVGLTEEQGSTPAEKTERIQGVYVWGNTWPPPKGAGNFNLEQNSDKFEKTSPVGSFEVKLNGLYDLSGNAWEFCEDWSDPEEKQFRVMRGASWDNFSPGGLLLSYRYWNTPDSRYITFGFRCVLAGGSGR
ncbi:MAG: SUMF1/EgtB/PvdO family nonheme iron enzyme [Verrucomicrobia subdivision 3 bacterium]|nr:SUMF1/EgtB/PvdO family nonheme iron enzyme [Limisphaerales bacterium]